MTDCRWEMRMCIVCYIFFSLFLLGCWGESDVKMQTTLHESQPSRQEIIGERLYRAYCAGCHGDAGAGDGMHSYTLNPPPADHTDSVYMSSLSDGYVLEIISNGGVSVGKSPEMPPWRQVLNKNEIRNIIIYMRTLYDGAQSLPENSRGS